MKIKGKQLADTLRSASNSFDAIYVDKTVGLEIETPLNQHLQLEPKGNGKVQIKGNDNPAELQLYCETNDQHFAALKAPSHSDLLSGGSVTFTLPSSYASNSGDALVSDTQGNLSFATIGGNSLQLDSTPKTSSFSASFGYIYLVNAQNANTVVSINLPAVTGQYNRFRVFNYGAGSVQFTTASTANSIEEHEGNVGLQKQKTFNSNCIIDVFLIGSHYEWIVSPQLEIEGETAFSASGEFLVFDNTTKKMTPSSYTLPTSIGTNNQVLTVNGSNVIFQSPSTPALNDLSDVTITSVNNLDVLQYNSTSSNWTNVKPFSYLNYTYSGSNVTAEANRGYLLGASVTVTLPETSDLRQGDQIAVTTTDLYNITIEQDSNDSGNLIYYVGSATYANNHILAIEKQEILIRFNGSVFYITSRPLISALEDDTSPSLSANLNLNGLAIVNTNSTTKDITLRPSGTGSVNLLNLTQSPELRFTESTNHQNYVALKPAATISTSVTFTLPNALPTNAGDALVSDASGNLSFTTIGGGGGGAYTNRYASISNATTAQANYHYSCTAALTLTLPTSGVVAGDQIRVKNMGTGTVTVARNGLTIDGLSNNYTLDVQYSSVTFVYTGSNYEVV